MLKKYLILWLVFFVLIMATEGASANNSGDVRVFLEQRELSFDSSPIIVTGRVFVPMRSIFEALGATVEWLPHDQAIIARRKGQIVTFGVNSSFININGRLEIIDAVPRIIRDRMFVPLRVITQALGAQVNWNSRTRRVNITASTAEIPAPLTIMARVLSVVNSNTMIVDINGKTEKIRLIGVGIAQKDRPHRADIPFGSENLSFIKNQIENETVWLDFDIIRGRDPKGALFAFIWVKEPKDGSEAMIQTQMLNMMLLSRGYAKFNFDTAGVRYLMDLTRAEHVAIRAQKGIWSEYHPNPTHNRALKVLAINHTAEYILLKNENTMDTDISGWTILSDHYSQRFVFPQGTIIPVGESFKVVSGSNAQQGRFLWTTDNVWHDRRAEAIIYNTEDLQTGGLLSIR